MTYDRQILEILTDVGEKGISLIESMDRRGYYRLNTQNNPDARQLMIEFREEQIIDEKEEKPSKDLSLDLFS